jgi:DNA modification methylase
MGSGSVGVACVELGRDFIGIEKEPIYLQQAACRIEQAKAMVDAIEFPPPSKPDGR